MAQARSMTRWILGAMLVAVVLFGAYWWAGRSPVGAPAAVAPAAERAAELVAASGDEGLVVRRSEPAGESLRVADAAPAGVAHVVDVMGRPLAAVAVRTVRDGVATEQSTAADGSFAVASEGRSALQLPPEWEVVSVDGRSPEPASSTELPRGWLVQPDAVVVAASLGDVELSFVDVVVPGTLRSGTVHLSAGTGAPLRSFPVVNSKASIRAPSGDYDVFVELAETLPQVLELGQRLPVVRGVAQRAEVLVLSEVKEAIALTRGEGQPFFGSVDIGFLLIGVSPFPSRRFDVEGYLQLSRVELRGGKGIASLARREPASSSVLRRAATLRADAETRMFAWTDGATVDLSPTDLLAVSVDTAELPWKELRSASLRGWGEPESVAGNEAMQDGSRWHWRDVVAGPYIVTLRHANGQWIYETPVMLVGEGEAAPLDVTGKVVWGEEMRRWRFASEPAPAGIESLPFSSTAARGRRLFGTADRDTGFPVLAPGAQSMTLGGEVAAGVVVLPAPPSKTEPGVHTFSSTTVRVHCETADGTPLVNARVWVQSGQSEAVHRADSRGQLVFANCAPDMNFWLLGPGDVPLADTRLRAQNDSEPTSDTEGMTTERAVTLRATRTARVVVANTGECRRGEMVQLMLTSVPGTRVDGLLPLPARFERWLEAPGSVTLHEVPEGDYVLSVALADGTGRQERRVHVAARDLVALSISESHP